MSVTPTFSVNYLVFAVLVMFLKSLICPPLCSALDLLEKRNTSIHNFQPDPGKHFRNFSNASERKHRLLSMFNTDAFNCAPQVMCWMISAKEPGPKTDVLNDYKYLFKEIFLKSENSEEDKLNKLSKLRASLKSRPSRKKISFSSDSEESSSKSIEIKDKAQGAAELMELEEEEEIENLAIEDMINEGDSDDLLFALADAKKKQKLQEMAHIRVSQMHGRFKRGTSKQGRQCRALFSDSTSSCSMTQEAINDLVEKIKLRFAGGSGSHQTRNMNIEDVVAIIKEVQKQQPITPSANSLPDVRVVLNIGGGQPPYSLPLSEGIASQPIDPNLNGQSPLSHYWTSTTTAPISRKTRLPNFSTMSVRSSGTATTPTPKLGTTTHDPTKQSYKQQLFKASKLLKKAMAMARPKMTGKIPQKKPKKIPDSLESNSVESLEESSEELFPVSPLFLDYRTRNLLGGYQPFQPVMVAATTPKPIRDRRVFHENTNWLGGIYNVLFKDRRVRPLPSRPEEWVPSAIRHSRHYYYPRPKRPATFPVVNPNRNRNAFRQGPRPPVKKKPATKMTQIAFVSNARIKTNVDNGPAKPKTKPLQTKKLTITSKKNLPKPKVSKSKVKKNAMKYKTCCSSPKPKNTN